MVSADLTSLGLPRLGVLVAILAIASIACGGPRDRRTFEFRGPTMGTTFSVKIVTGSDGLSGPDRALLNRAIRAELERINALMSTWDPESELSRFNRSVSQDPFPVSPETFEVFRWALELGALTDGALDVTVAPLVDAWGFGSHGRLSTVPTDTEIARLREMTGMHLLELDAVAETVRKQRPEVACDFSALAPGYAADRLWTMLLKRDVGDFLVDVGGELRASGHNEAGAPWQIGIERPQTVGRAVERTVPILDRAIATSGDYRNYYEVNGTRVAHILDPRTGRPIQHRLASVTVIDELAVRADGISTALMVLGPDQGFALAERLGLPVLFIVRDEGGGFTERATPRFDAITTH
jgi:thiamine biosynthesis lipoprotein